MFTDVRKWVDAHPGAVIMSADHPQWLQIGFVAYVGSGDDEQFYQVTMSISDASKSSRAIADGTKLVGHDNIVDVIRSKLLGSPSGRREVCRHLSNGSLGRNLPHLPRGAV